MKLNRQLGDEWFLAALDDERSCTVLLREEDGSPNTVCFLSQQLAEKSLKGYLATRERPFPKIHQLDRLLRLCQEQDPEFSVLREASEFLSGFYVQTRYPDDRVEYSWEDASTAFAQALRVKDHIRTALFVAEADEMNEGQS